MAYFRKDRGMWRVQVYKNGTRKSASFDTKTEAKEWAAKTEASLADRKGMNNRIRFSEVIDRYVREVVPEHKGARWEVIRLTRLSERLGNVTLGALVHGDALSLWKTVRMQEVSPASVRREMNLLNQVFETARKEWRMLVVNPLTGVRKPQAPAARVRLVSDEEVAAVVAKLGYVDGEAVTTTGQQVALAFLIALETAMRASEVLQIPGNHERKVFTLIDSKNKQGRDVPLSPRARALTARIPAGGFTVASATLSVTFARARAACGFDGGAAGGFTFHDSRATALTRLSKKLDVLALAKMVGHRDPRSLMIYYRETAEDIADRL